MHTNTNINTHTHQYNDISIQIQLPARDFHALLPTLHNILFQGGITCVSETLQRSTSKYFLLVFQVSTFRFYLAVLDCEVARYNIFSDILPSFTYDVPPVISSLTQFRKLPPAQNLHERSPMLPLDQVLPTSPSTLVVES